MTQTTIPAVPFNGDFATFCARAAKPHCYLIFNQKFLPLLTKQQINTRLTQMLQETYFISKFQSWNEPRQRGMP